MADPIAAGNPNVDPESLHSETAARTNANLISQSSDAPDKLALHKVTPLVLSEPLSARTGHNIYLKLDALQPSGSFKIRGVGRTVAVAYEQHGANAHIVTSSGGNAGLAAATACKMMSLRCTIFVPSTTEASVVALLENLGATVHVGGDSWDGADAGARALVKSDKDAVYLHPFIGDILVQGHSSLVGEIYQQMEELSPSSQPDIIALTVGGAGLIHGLIEGLSAEASKRKDFKVPHVVGCQDFGADSFSQSFNKWLEDPVANADVHVMLPAITSKATSMGTKICSGPALIAAKRYAAAGPTVSRGTNASASTTINGHSENASPSRYLSTLVQSDSLAASSAWQFKRDHQLMVELSCGAALSVAYHADRVLPRILGTSGSSPDFSARKNIVIFVCGGSKVDQAMLDDYEQQFGEQQGCGDVSVNGQPV